MEGMGWDGMLEGTSERVEKEGRQSLTFPVITLCSMSFEGQIFRRSIVRLGTTVRVANTS